MPQPLSYFDNFQDPTLPIQITPVLYYYDEYQTYDLLLFKDFAYVLTVYINLQLEGKLNTPFSLLKTGHLTDAFYHLIERFAPFEYPWCDGYSSDWFHFIKKYARTSAYDSFAVNGFFFANYLSTRPNATMVYPMSADEYRFSQYVNGNLDLTPFLLPNVIKLKIPATQTEERLVVTWLDVDSAQSKEYVKRYKAIETFSLPFEASIYVTATYTENNIEQSVSAVHFSYVVSSGDAGLTANIESQFNNYSTGFLYKNLNKFFNTFDAAIAQDIPRLHFVLDNYYMSFDLVRGADPYEVSPGSSASVVNQVVTPTFRELNPDFYFATLVYANHNYWSNAAVPPVTYLGKPIAYQGDRFYVWGRPLERPDYSYDYYRPFYHEHFNDDSYKTDYYNILGYIHGWEVEYTVRPDVEGHHFERYTKGRYKDYSLKALDMSSDDGSTFIQLADTTKYYA